MNKRYRKRIISILKKLCEDLDNLHKLFLEERPFLLGGELEIKENLLKRKVLEVTLRQRLMDYKSLCNEASN